MYCVRSTFSLDVIFGDLLPLLHNNKFVTFLLNDINITFLIFFCIYGSLSNNNAYTGCNYLSCLHASQIK